MCNCSTSQRNYYIDTYNLCHPWYLFRMTELIDNMRSKDDQPFVEMLNRFRTATQTEEDIKCIQSRSIDSIDPGDVNYPSDAIHIFAENRPVDLRRDGEKGVGRT